MEKYFGKLIEDYEKVLVEELGTLKKIILSKLEEMINEKSQEDLLNKSIDYNALSERKNRIKNVLNINEIRTYKDLQRGCYDYSKDKSGSWKNEKTYVSYLNSFRNSGNKSVNLIISHLKSINFDFSKESARKVAEKSRA